MNSSEIDPEIFNKIGDPNAYAAIFHIFFFKYFVLEVLRPTRAMLLHPPGGEGQAQQELQLARPHFHIAK